MYYILIGKNPVKVTDTLTWGRWYEKQQKFGARHVGYRNIKARKPLNKGGKMLAKINRNRSIPIIISTVFLGLDHNHWGKQGDQPILFESMVFGGQFDDYQARYFTWDEAKEAHDRLVKDVTRKMVL